MVLLLFFALSQSYAELATSTSPESAPAPAPSIRPWETAEWKRCMEKKPTYEGQNSQGSGNIPSKDLFQKVALEKLPMQNLEGDLFSLRIAFRKQVARCRKQDLQESVTIGDRKLTRQEFCVEVNERLAEIAEDARTFKEFLVNAHDQFDWYQKIKADKSESSVLFTGYNAPTFEGELKKDGHCAFPVYKKPTDLVRIVHNGSPKTKRKDPATGELTPYFDREAIHNGALKGKNLEIICLKSALDLYNLQVEGSGYINYKGADGKLRQMHLGVDTGNGHPYVSLAKSMRCMGIEDKYLTDQGMKDYFKEHPEDLIPFLNLNRSYAFFKEDKGGPMGAANIELTPRHSLAVDNNLIPYGAVAMFATERPGPKGAHNGIPFSSMGLAQDRGAAIKGDHIDVFWGSDEYSQLAASSMNGRGSLFIAVPKVKTESAEKTFEPASN